MLRYYVKSSIITTSFNFKHEISKVIEIIILNIDSAALSIKLILIHLNIVILILHIRIEIIISLFGISSDELIINRQLFLFQMTKG